MNSVISRADATSAGLTHYFTGVPCKHGHLAQRYVKNTKCATCVFNTVTRHKIANAEKVAAYKQSYRDANRERLAAETHARRLMNPDKVKASKQKWRDQTHNRKKEYAYHGRRRATDPVFRMSIQMREMVRRVMMVTGDNKRRRPSRHILGYASNDLRLHLEQQFKPGMTWENYGEWHIDHKIPISLMILFGVTDPSLINALWNLQPLWAHENLAKGNRFVSP